MGVDLSAEIYAEYKRARQEASAAEQKGHFPAAAQSYRRAARLMRQYATYSRTPAIRSERLQRAQELERMADKLLALPTAPPPVQTSQERSPSEDYESIVLGLIQTTPVQWEDIGGLEETKAAIKSAYGLALARKPPGVQIDPLRNLLLYGPPGTGKTLLAAATAGSLEATFFNVRVSDVLSKYFGESSKLVAALFKAARQRAPAVVFLDEFESLTPPRESGESGAERRIVSQFLAELDGLESKGNPAFVLTIGATNVPWLLDTAILARFQRRIYVPLPDDPARLAILKIVLERRGHQTHVPYAALVKRTAGFSGREIEQLCQAAITHMIQRANPQLLRVVERGQKAIANYELKVEPLSEEDFAKAFGQVHPLTTPEMLARYDAWQRQTELNA